MNVHLFIHEALHSTDPVSVISKIDAIVDYCKKNKISKVLVDRPDIIATKSRAPKAVIHVNIDSFVKMLVVRGIAAVSFTNVTQYPVISVSSWIEGMEKQTVTLIEQNKFNAEDILVISSTVNIAADHVSIERSPLKQHARENDWHLKYINIG